MLAIAMFVLYVTVCEIIAYKLPMHAIPIFDHEMKVNEVDELDNSAGERMFSTCMYKLALLDPAVRSQYIIVHFVTYKRTYVRKFVHTAR